MNGSEKNLTPSNLSKGLYYDPDGKSISENKYLELMSVRRQDMSDESWWRKTTRISEKVTVSTVWLGIDHDFGYGDKPLIFETMIFGGEFDDYQWRYTTKEEAWAHHDKLVELLLAGKEVESLNDY